MSAYLEILAIQSPFPFAEDENDRIMFSFNVDVLAAAPVNEFEEELAKLINNAGLGTRGVDVFIGPKAVVPDGDGPYITLLDTGGREPEETHNGGIYERLSAQIVVRGMSYTATRTRAKSIQRVLDGVRNTTVAA